MAQFKAVIGGGRGEASRLGTKKSGIMTEANGWTSGVRVVGTYVEDKDCDQFDIFMTTGSSSSQGATHLGTIVVKDGTPIFNLAK